MTETRNVPTAAELLAHLTWARRLARVLVHDSESEDLVQEAWEAQLRAKPTNDRPLSGWLRRVLQTRAANRRRSTSRREIREFAYSTKSSSELASPEELTGRMELQRQLADLVERLDPPLRETLLLRYYDGLTSQEIGTRMRIPAGTVRRRLKTAVDQLRKWLDEEYGERPKEWLRVLAPLAESRPASRAHAIHGLSRGSLVALAGGLASVAASLAFVTCPGGIDQADPRSLALEAVSVEPATGGPANPARGGTRSSEPPAPRFVAAGSLANGDCLAELESVRERLSKAELDYRRSASAQELFDEGSPNPTARAALLPDVERVFRQQELTAPFTLECKGWVCRLLVLQEPDGPRAWIEALQRQGQAWRERVRGGSSSGRRTKDPITGRDLEEVQIIAKLADLSGRRVPFDETPTAPIDRPSPPETEAACRLELEQSRKRRAQIQLVIDKRLPPSVRFDRAISNPELTARVQPIVAGAIAPLKPVAALSVTCQGAVCRITEPVPKGADVRGFNAMKRSWWGPVTKNPDFKRLFGGAQMSVGVGQAYFLLAAP